MELVLVEAVVFPLGAAPLTVEFEDCVVLPEAEAEAEGEGTMGCVVVKTNVLVAVLSCLFGPNVMKVEMVVEVMTVNEGAGVD